MGNRSYNSRWFPAFYCITALITIRPLTNYPSNAIIQNTGLYTLHLHPHSPRCFCYQEIRADKSPPALWPRVQVTSILSCSRVRSRALTAPVCGDAVAALLQAQGWLRAAGWSQCSCRQSSAAGPGERDGCVCASLCERALPGPQCAT